MNSFEEGNPEKGDDFDYEKIQLLPTKKRKSLLKKKVNQMLIAKLKTKQNSSLGSGVVLPSSQSTKKLKKSSQLSFGGKLDDLPLPSDEDSFVSGDSPVRIKQKPVNSSKFRQQAECCGQEQKALRDMNERMQAMEQQISNIANAIAQISSKL